MEEALTILVVDDDKLDRMAVRRALRTVQPPITIEEAEDGDSALAALTHTLFDCIVLDYRLAGTDGLTVLKSLHANGIKVPVVMLTGQGDERLAVELIKAGATDYLSKAMVSPEVLATSIRNAIRIHRAEIQTREAENALRESEARFRTMADSAPVLLWMANPNGERLFFNESWLQFTGNTQAEAVGFGWQSSVHPDDRPQLLAVYEAAYTQQTPFEIEYRLRRADGAFRWLLESGLPRFMPDGSFVGYIGSGSDITDRKRAEEAQRFLAEASQVLSSSLDAGVVLSNLAQLAVPYLAEWCLVDIVQETAEDTRLKRLVVTTAYADKQGVAEQLQDALLPYPSDGEAARNSLSVVIKTGQSVRHARRPRRKLVLSDFAEDDPALAHIADWTSIMSVPLVVRANVLGAITFIRTGLGTPYVSADLALAEDLGRRAAVAVENAQLYHEAQEAIQMREVFLSVASHELKTPLTSLSGNAQLLEGRAMRDGSLNARDLKTLNVIVVQATRLNKMIEMLLDISRLQHGQLTIQPEPMDFGALAQQLVEEIRPSLDNHTLEVYGAENSLPILGDALRLEQVFQNLVQNAIKYSPKGGAVEIHLFRQAGFACVAIVDHGMGIPQSALPRLFERFYRAPNANDSPIKGIGVGLYVVKAIIGLHGGLIDIASVEGQGSTFTIKLPLAETGPAPA